MLWQGLRARLALSSCVPNPLDTSLRRTKALTRTSPSTGKDHSQHPVCLGSTCMTSLGMTLIFLFIRPENLAAKWRTRRGMSSRRSRSEGTRPRPSAQSTGSLSSPGNESRNTSTYHFIESVAILNPANLRNRILRDSGDVEVLFDAARGF